MAKKIIKIETTDVCKTPQEINIDINASSVTNASEVNHGIVQKATQQEVVEGMNDHKYVTPKTLHNKKASKTNLGILMLGEGLEYNSQTDAVDVVSVNNTIPIASQTKLGGIRVGTGLRIDPVSGILSVVSSGCGGGGGGGDPINWEEIDDHIDSKVDDKIQDIIDLIEGGELSEIDINTLRATVNMIVDDHSRVLDLISDYELPDSFSIPYNDAYTALMLYIQPYIDGTHTVVADPATFEQMFKDYYQAKGDIEREVVRRSVLNQKQAEDTREALSKVFNFAETQLLDIGVVTGTLAVGTPTYNNAGVTGVTDQGQDSVRFWAGGTYENRYNASFRVLNNGKLYAGNATSGFDYGITRANTMSIRGALILDSGGNPSYLPVNRGPYNPLYNYEAGNIVSYENILWEYINEQHGNGGVPNESNSNWRVYLSGGTGVFRSYVYTRSATPPVTPTGGTYENPLPVETEWSDGPPAGIEPLWQSNRIFTETGQPPQESAWKTPYEASDSYDEDWEWCSLDTDDINLVGNPDTMPAIWSNDPSNAVWEAKRKKINNVEMSWVVIRIKGENGDQGADGADGADGPPGYYEERRYAVNGSYIEPPTPPSPGERNPTTWTVTIPAHTELEYVWKITATINPVNNSMVTTWTTPVRETGARGMDGDGATTYKSLVFRRSATDIGNTSNRPTGGTVSNPIPSGGLWFDGIPQSGTGPVWMSSRIFSTDPDSQDDLWTIPALMADTPTMMIRYAEEFPASELPPNNTNATGSGWSASSSSTTYYMAVRTKQGTVGGTWTAWSKTRIKGEAGANGAPGTTPPIVINMGDYSPTQTYKGNSTEIHYVTYGNPTSGYYTQVNAGEITGIPPTDTSKWNPIQLQTESLSAKIAVIASAEIAKLSANSVVVRSSKTGNSSQTSIGKYTTDHDDPTSSSSFDDNGIRTWYKSGRIAAYTGIVESFSVGSVTLNGYVTIVFKDEEGSPISSYMDYSLAQEGFKTTTVTTWYEITRFKQVSTSLSSSATDSQLLDLMFFSGSPRIPRNTFFCGAYNGSNLSLDIAIPSTTSPSRIWRRVTTSPSSVSYVTTNNGTTPVTNGWYLIGNVFSGVETSKTPFHIDFSATIKAVYINSGAITVEKTLTIPQIYVEEGSPLGSCPSNSNLKIDIEWNL